MKQEPDETKRSNHLQSLLFMLVIGGTLVAGWNALGAANCMWRGGAVQISGFNMGCSLD